MSGAEALVALGLAANVLQFVEFTAELCERIRDYSTGPGMPRKLAAQADRLSDLLILLKALSQSSKDRFEQSVLARCQAQAEDMSLLLHSLKGSKKGQDRWWTNAKKALRSLSQAEKIQEVQNVMDSLLSILSIHLQAQARSVRSLYVTAHLRTLKVFHSPSSRSCSVASLVVAKGTSSTRTKVVHKD